MATKCRFGSQQIQHHPTQISVYANINNMRGTVKTLQQPQSQYQWSLYRNLVLQPEMGMEWWPPVHAIAPY
jgi:hypothetical protein